MYRSFSKTFQQYTAAGKTLSSR